MLGFSLSNAGADTKIPIFDSQDPKGKNDKQMLDNTTLVLVDIT